MWQPTSHRQTTWTLAGFIVSDFSDQFATARQWISEHVQAERIRQRLHVLDGIEQAPAGLQMLFESQNFGKLVVKVHDESSGH